MSSSPYQDHRNDDETGEDIMKTLTDKITSIAAGAVTLLVGCMLAGLGLTVMAFLAIFALAAIGLAIIAAPFVALSRRAAEEDGIVDVEPRTATA